MDKQAFASEVALATYPLQSELFDGQKSFRHQYLSFTL